MRCRKSQSFQECPLLKVLPIAVIYAQPFPCLLYVCQRLVAEGYQRPARAGSAELIYPRVVSCVQQHMIPHHPPQSIVARPRGGYVVLVVSRAVKHLCRLLICPFPICFFHIIKSYRLSLCAPQRACRPALRYAASAFSCSRNEYPMPV